MGGPNAGFPGVTNRGETRTISWRFSVRPERYWLIIKCVIDGISSKVVTVEKILYEGNDAEARAKEAAKIIDQTSNYIGAVVIPG